MLERDAREGDGLVVDVEGWTGGLPQPAAAVEKGGRRHAANDESDSVADVDGGLVEHAGAEVHVRGADKLNSVSDGSADEGGVALRVVAGERVDLDGNTGGGGSWNRRQKAK